MLFSTTSKTLASQIYCLHVLWLPSICRVWGFLVNFFVRWIEDSNAFVARQWQQHVCRYGKAIIPMLATSVTGDSNWRSHPKSPIVWLQVAYGYKWLRPNSQFSSSFNAIGCVLGLNRNKSNNLQPEKSYSSYWGINKKRYTYFANFYPHVITFSSYVISIAL